MDWAGFGAGASKKRWRRVFADLSETLVVLVGKYPTFHTCPSMRGSWLVLLALGSLLGAGCEKTIYRSHESHYCSSTADDEPYYECAKGSDLVCVTTYKMSYGATASMPDGKTIDIWVCRLACTPGKDECVAGEVCCPGKIYGQTYGKDHVCVPPDYCPALAVPPGSKDAGGDAKGDARPDGGADTGPPDAPESPDSADAPSDDVPADLPPG
jgi:hypothetical protein